jgi:deoxyribose-phosphate aldolase
MINSYVTDPRVQAFASGFHFGVLGEEKVLADVIAEAQKLRRSGLNIEAFDCEVMMLDAARDTLGGYAKLHVPIGYPAGNATLKQKMFQLEYLLGEGIDDSCYCLDYANLVDGNWDAVTAETARVMDLCKNRLPMAMVIQATLLNDRQIEAACKAILQGGANRVKMNTGYGWGTSLDEVELVHRHFNGQIDIHPSGNVRALAQVDHFLARGIGIVHSASVFEIVDEYAARLGLTTNTAKAET